MEIDLVLLPRAASARPRESWEVDVVCVPSVGELVQHPSGSERWFTVVEVRHRFAKVGTLPPAVIARERRRPAFAV